MAALRVVQEGTEHGTHGETPQAQGPLAEWGRGRQRARGEVAFTARGEATARRCWSSCGEQPPGRKDERGMHIPTKLRDLAALGAPWGR